MRIRLASFFVLALLCAPLVSQTNTTSTNLTASVVVQRSYLSLTGGNSISSVMLAGTEVRTEGSLQVQGPVSLAAYGNWDARIQDTKGVELRNHPSTPSGRWTDSDGSVHAAAIHNCMTDAVWFFPPLLGMYANDPTVKVSYVGHETWKGIGVEHLAYYRAFIGARGEDIDAEALSRNDVYLDSSTYLPVRMVFFAHPDNDESSGLVVEIRYSNYQNSGGINLPYHVQRYLQGTLQQDISITSVAVNPGLSDGDFQD